MKWIFNPIIKAIISVTSTFLTGILCSAIVAELTGSNGVIKWADFYKKATFYIIIALVLLSIVYYVITAKEEYNYRKKLNNKFLDKFIKEKGLDDLSTKVAEAIRLNDKSKLSNLLDMKELITKNLEA